MNTKFQNNYLMNTQMIVLFCTLCFWFLNKNLNKTAHLWHIGYVNNLVINSCNRMWAFFCCWQNPTLISTFKESDFSYTTISIQKMHTWMNRSVIHIIYCVIIWSHIHLFITYLFTPTFWKPDREKLSTKHNNKLFEIENNISGYKC